MNTKEIKLLSERLADIQCEAIEKVVSLADDLKVDRDKTVELFVATLIDISTVGSFKDYIPRNKK